MKKQHKNAIIFNYKDGELFSITDIRGRNVFVSSGNGITTITYQDGSQLKATFLGSETKMVESFEKDGTRAILDYTASGNLQKVRRYNWG